MNNKIQKFIILINNELKKEFKFNNLEIIKNFSKLEIKNSKLKYLEFKKEKISTLKSYLKNLKIELKRIQSLKVKKEKEKNILEFLILNLENKIKDLK